MSAAAVGEEAGVAPRGGIDEQGGGLNNHSSPISL
jgi:hypothetical protein